MSTEKLSKISTIFEMDQMPLKKIRRARTVAITINEIVEARCQVSVF